MAKRKLATEDKEKLQKALRVQGASERAVHDIWNIFQSDHADLKRNAFLDVVDEELLRWRGCLTPTAFQKLDGSEIHIPILDLQKALQEFCKDTATAPFVKAIRVGLQDSGIMRPIIYCDEATAGNVLSVAKSRKAMIYNLGWLEMWHYLKNQHAWLPVAIVQSACLSKLRGGSSAIMVAILKQVVTVENERGFWLSTGLFFRQSQEAWFLGDHDAVRSVLSLKGSAGIRPCVYCKNIVSAKSSLTEYEDCLKDISASSGFAVASDEEIFALCDKMLRPCTKRELDLQERCSGITYVRGSLLFDHMERSKLPPSRIMYDFMHTYLHNGVASREVHLYLTAVFQETEITRELLQNAVVASDWLGNGSTMKRKAALKHLLDAAMFGEDVYKGEANDTAALLPLLRYYTETMIAPGKTGTCREDCILHTAL